LRVLPQLKARPDRPGRQHPRHPSSLPASTPSGHACRKTPFRIFCGKSNTFDLPTFSFHPWNAVKRDQPHACCIVRSMHALSMRHRHIPGEETMEDKLVQRIKADPDYHTLVSRRSTYGWVLSVIMLVVYYGYILLIAFNRDLLATRIGNGVMTWGIPIGLAVIVFTVLITGIYVRRANGEFDELTARIREKALR
jgi:uncharacterized membrane protein (DUF485 family)